MQKPTSWLYTRCLANFGGTSYSCLDLAVTCTGRTSYTIWPTRFYSFVFWEVTHVFDDIWIEIPNVLSFLVILTCDMDNNWPSLRHLAYSWNLTFVIFLLWVQVRRRPQVKFYLWLIFHGIISILMIWWNILVLYSKLSSVWQEKLN
jgi:hypothetical protein